MNSGFQMLYIKPHRTVISERGKIKLRPVYLLPKITARESLQVAVLKGVFQEEPSSFIQLRKKELRVWGKLNQLEFSGKDTREEKATQESFEYLPPQIFN